MTSLLEPICAATLKSAVELIVDTLLLHDERYFTYTASMLECLGTGTLIYGRCD
jgi:hypothetical protein